MANKKILVTCYKPYTGFPGACGRKKSMTINVEKFENASFFLKKLLKFVILKSSKPITLHLEPMP